jgi:hypothetical protein
MQELILTKNDDYFMTFLHSKCSVDVMPIRAHGINQNSLSCCSVHINKCCIDLVVIHSILRCYIGADPCSKTPCQHGGTCISGGVGSTTYSCKCTAYYEGAICDKSMYAPTIVMTIIFSTESRKKCSQERAEIYIYHRDSNQHSRTQN